jgi:hypothetical protein
MVFLSLVVDATTPAGFISREDDSGVLRRHGSADLRSGNASAFERLCQTIRRGRIDRDEQAARGLRVVAQVDEC